MSTHATTLNLPLNYSSYDLAKAISAADAPLSNDTVAELINGITIYGELSAMVSDVGADEIRCHLDHIAGEVEAR